MKWFKSKLTYTQEEIVVQQEIIAESIRQRSVLLRTGIEEDINRANASVEVAQEILNFMLESVLDECS